tara:strand:+ start:445 stop:1302 length:858 start_codon:yes stop_codon:yes gene_type:complete
MKTIAFSNKGNYWTTRYSFVSSCIGWIKDHMVTSPTLAQAKEVLWKHDGSSDDNNKFYGVSYNSVIAATFSQAPSVNKQYKAFSIESANPANLAGSNLFIPNKGGQNVVPKETTIGKLTERGGIIYGHIGQENRITMSNIEFVGVVENKQPASQAFTAEEIAELGITSSAVFLKLQAQEHTAGSFQSPKVTDNPALFKEDPLTHGLSTFPPSIPMFYKGGILLPSSSGGGVTLTIGSPVYLCYQEQNGEAPKGQVADVIVDFGREDFEVYALNVEYSPTNLDHSK